MQWSQQLQLVRFSTYFVPLSTTTSKEISCLDWFVFCASCWFNFASDLTLTMSELEGEWFDLLRISFLIVIKFRRQDQHSAQFDTLHGLFWSFNLYIIIIKELFVYRIPCPINFILKGYKVPKSLYSLEWMSFHLTVPWSMFLWIKWHQTSSCLLLSKNEFWIIDQAHWPRYHLSALNGIWAPLPDIRFKCASLLFTEILDVTCCTREIIYKRGPEIEPILLRENRRK